MTQLVCDVHKILDEGPIDGVVRISAAHTQYAGTSLMVPEFAEKELIAGKVTFDNVEPGRAIVQIHWGFNSSVTLRVSVPEAETVRLSELALQDYDFEPIVVGEVTKQANSAAESMESALDYLSKTQEQADRAKNEADDSASSATAAAGSASGAKAAQTAAASSKTAAATSASKAAASATQADSSEFEAATSASAASASQSAAKTSETNAAGSASKAKTSENNASASEAQAKQSEANAGASETAAAGSEQAAAGSESAAAGSASAAASSAAQADTASTQAGTSRDEAKAASRQSGDYRDGAKDHREAAAQSEDNAATSAESANTSANTASTKATEVSGKLQQALDAISSAEGIEDALRTLMADTEAWQSVQYALGQVDTDIAAAMEQVKEEILGGVGPAFDTLLELSEALGDNAEALGTITNSLADKSEKGHTHKSADITDAYHFTGGTMKDRVVKTYTDGHIFSASDPQREEHITRKAYVDNEVATKAEKGHTHTISETSGLSDALNGKSPKGHIHAIEEVDGLDAALAARSADGHKHTSADITDATNWINHPKHPSKMVKTRADGYVHGSYPKESPHVAIKGYVDDELAKKANADHEHELADLPHATNANGNTLVSRSGAGHFFVNDPSVEQHPASKGYVDNAAADAVAPLSGSGASIIPTLPGSRAQKWASELATGGTEGTPTGRYYSNKNGGNSVEAFFQVDPDLDYYVSMHVNASKAGSRIYIELRDQDGDHAVASGNPQGSGTYLLSSYEMPTSWTKLESTNMRFTTKSRFVTVDTIYWNHSKGDVRDATQYLTDIQLIPIPKLSSKDIADASYQIGDNNVPGRLVTAHPTNGDIYRYGTAEPSNSAALVNKFYVDREVAKKADTGHTHASSEISDTTTELTSIRPDKIVRTNADGTIQVHNHTIEHDYNVTNKAYVDTEVSKKANSSHTHTSSDIADTVYRAGATGSARKVISASGTGRLYYDRTPGATDELVNKEYVDSRPATWIHEGGLFTPDPKAAEGDVVIDLSTGNVHKIINGGI